VAKIFAVHSNENEVNMNVEFCDDSIKILALILIAFALYQARQVTQSFLITIRERAKEIPGKHQLLKEARWDFNILFAAVILLVSGILQLIERQTFVDFLTAVLAALGVKSVAELRRKDDVNNGPDDGGEGK
jgi:Na+/H+ antiporter NhaD/arsenite permease-like protein